jgi:hypothetical protein
MTIAMAAWTLAAATITGNEPVGIARTTAHARRPLGTAATTARPSAPDRKPAPKHADRRGLVISTSDAIPLRDAKHRKNMFVASLTGSAIRGADPYEVNFDTGSSQLCLPYGCLDKTRLTVLERDVRDCWGTRADKVKGQIAMVSRDGKTTYVVDDYPFYATKDEDGSDLPADSTAPWNSAIMGAYPGPEAFTYVLARKYCRNGFIYGIVCENQSGDIVTGWDAFRAYLKIGIEPVAGGKLNWHHYTPWFPGQTELQVVNLPGWALRLTFPKVNGKRTPDIVVPNQIATIDTGAPDLTLRLARDDPHRREPYKQFFADNGPSWYRKDKCRVAADGVTVRVSFTGSSGQTSSYQWTVRDPKGRYVPNGMIVGDWTAGIPWGEAPETPTNRLNLGNSIYYFLHAHVWDIANRRVGFWFR